MSDMKSLLAIGLFLLNPLVANANGAVSDPTRPWMGAEAPKVETVDAFRVTAIVISGSRRVAVINGRSVTRGDTLGDARVIDIQPSQVRLRRGGQTLVARLVETTVEARD